MIDGILAALASGREKLGITSALILCILRHLPEEDGFETLRAAEPWTAVTTGVSTNTM